MLCVSLARSLSLSLSLAIFFLVIADRLVYEAAVTPCIIQTRILIEGSR
jgi:hypothetical protein